MVNLWVSNKRALFPSDMSAFSAGTWYVSQRISDVIRNSDAGVENGADKQRFRVEKGDDDDNISSLETDRSSTSPVFVFVYFLDVPAVKPNAGNCIHDVEESNSDPSSDLIQCIQYRQL